MQGFTLKTKASSIIFIGLLFLFFISSCTPKVSEVTSPTESKPVVTPPPSENLSPCRKFSDNPNSDDLLNDFVIYRDFLKLGKYEESFPQWEKVYKSAPAADGQRWTVYTDGVKYYEYFLTKTDDAAERTMYQQKIFEMYEQIMECYPAQSQDVKARMAYDYYYQFPELKTDMQKYQLFKEVVDVQGMEMPVFVVNPFTKLAVDLYRDGKIEKSEMKADADLIKKRVAEGIDSKKDYSQWLTVRDYALPYLEMLEADKGFYDCAYYQEKYYNNTDISSLDCEAALELYAVLRFGDCDKLSSQLVSIYNHMKSQGCIETNTQSNSLAGQAYKCLEDGDYNCAVAKYEAAADEQTDIEKKSRYYLTAAKIYYSHLKDYPKARGLAKKAAFAKANWGDPYILIGKLYASSGPLCGPGRGFDSQVVTWVAIDKWNYAKSIDPSVSAEANKLIQTYTKYMPDKESIHQRLLKIGQTFKVPCWIQENTKVRSSD